MNNQAYQFFQTESPPLQKEVEHKLTHVHVPCPECEGKLVLKDSGSHTYFGCEHFPKCGATMKINRPFLASIISRFLEMDRSTATLQQYLN